MLDAEAEQEIVEEVVVARVRRLDPAVFLELLGGPLPQPSSKCCTSTSGGTRPPTKSPEVEGLRRIGLGGEPAVELGPGRCS